MNNTGWGTRLGKALDLCALWWWQMPSSSGCDLQQACVSWYPPATVCRHQPAAEEQARCHCGARRVLHSYWVGEDSMYKLFKVVLIDPLHRPSDGIPAPRWSLSQSTTLTGRCEGWHLQAARATALEMATSPSTLLVALTLQRGEGITNALQLHCHR